MLLREADQRDVPAITLVIRAAFAEYAGRLNPPSSGHKKTEAQTAEELARGSGFVVLADQQLVASIFYRLYPEYIYLSRLAVLPEYRRRGIGRLLIRAVEIRGQSLGLAAAQLGVRLALAENQRYYERLGYRRLHYGTHSGFSEPTYLVMRKQLNANSEREAEALNE